MALFPFGSPFDNFNDDQPFGGIMQHFSTMMDPFNSFFGSRSHSMFPMPFAMDSFVNNLHRDMSKDFSHSYSTSTVMTMSSGPDGNPQIYQESRSTRTAPGGVTETKKAVCDSRTGTKRMAIGHHIGERGHVRERVQNIRSGEQEEAEDFINLEEDEAEEFNREWVRKARDTGGYRSIEPRRQRHLPAITSGRSRSRLTPSLRRSYPALTYSSQQEEEPEIIPKTTRKRPGAAPYVIEDAKRSHYHKKEARQQPRE